MKHSSDELKELQALPLDDKITLTKLRITEWYNHYNGNMSTCHSVVARTPLY